MNNKWFAPISSRLVPSPFPFSPISLFFSRPPQSRYTAYSFELTVGHLPCQTQQNVVHFQHIRSIGMIVSKDCITKCVQPWGLGWFRVSNFRLKVVQDALIFTFWYSRKSFTITQNALIIRLSPPNHPARGRVGGSAPVHALGAQPQNPFAP